MPPTLRPSPIQTRAGLYALRVVCVVLVAVTLAGYAFYTTVGIDSDRTDGPVVRHAYYRIQWPGDGAFLVTVGENHAPPQPGEHLMPFDLAGRFFQAPRREPGGSLWRRLGFRYVYRVWEVPPGARSGARPYLFTLGVPAPLLPAFAALLLVLRTRRRRAPAA
jgi:hypothetical protein